jgi:hypothetical protein
LSEPIPQGPEALTAPWFNRTVAARHPLIPAARALTVDNGVRQGMMSRVCRITPAYAGPAEAAPQSFIVELAAADPEMRQREANRQAALKEVRFYQTLAARIDVRTPACYLADVDFESGYHVLVLEDLVTLAQRLPESGCLQREAERAVDALARLQAAWWGRGELEGLEWLKQPERLNPAEVRARHRRWWPAFREIAGPLLPEELLTFGDRLGDRFADLMNRLLFEPPRTLRHGDFSLSNLFFAAEGPPVVIDWQMLSRGKGAWDLAWFLGQSLTIEQRRAWEADLLDRYRRALIGGGVRDYTVDVCLADYRLAIAQRFGTLISSVVVLPFSAAQKEEILRVQVPRNVAAILDHGGVELIG